MTGKAAWPRKAKAQQNSAWSEELESTTRERGSRKEIRRTFKILREVWLNIGVEKIDMHEGIMIKVLLDSGTTGIFMDRRMAARHGFKLQKLERPIAVRNVNSTNNSGGTIMHQVECNVKRVQKGIAHWDKQNNNVPVPNCMLKVQGKIIKVEGL